MMAGAWWAWRMFTRAAWGIMRVGTPGLLQHRVRVAAPAPALALAAAAGLGPLAAGLLRLLRHGPGAPAGRQRPGGNDGRRPQPRAAARRAHRGGRAACGDARDGGGAGPRPPARAGRAAGAPHLHDALPHPPAAVLRSALRGAMARWRTSDGQTESVFRAQLATAQPGGERAPGRRRRRRRRSAGPAGVEAGDRSQIADRRSASRR
jgi:hypothetical protein